MMKQQWFYSLFCLLALSMPGLATPLTPPMQAIGQSNSQEVLQDQAIASSQLPEKDQQIFDQLISSANQQQIKTQPLSQVLEFFALKLLDQPYKAGLLDQSPQEDLFLSLTQFDCVLFVESVLAIAHSFQSDTPSVQTFAQRVEDLRYRNGQRTTYCSRLHYFSEWLDNNQTRGHLRNITTDLGGVPLDKQLQFMSRHRSSYRQLAQPDAYNCIVQMENRLASLPMHYIPTAQIAGIEAQLQPGDIIAVATAVPYLDVTHTGLIYQDSLQKGLVHASPGGSVRLASNLTAYVSNVESAIGIMVARPAPAEKDILSSR